VICLVFFRITLAIALRIERRIRGRINRDTLKEAGEDVQVRDDK
jgi:hypothetical protein